MDKVQITKLAWDSLKAENNKLRHKWYASSRQAQNNSYAIKRYKKQLTLDAKFKQILKDNYPLIYKEIVRKLQEKVD